MTGTGLAGVPDPSRLFGLTVAGEIGSAVACALEGTRPILLEIQALVAPTDLAMPRRVATGVDPKRLAMLVAVLTRHGRVPLGQADVFVNVAGGVRIDEPGRRPRRLPGDRLRGAGRARPRRPGRVRRGRAHGTPAARDPGRAAARGVRQARPDGRPRADRVRAHAAGTTVHEAETIRVRPRGRGLERPAEAPV